MRDTRIPMAAAAAAVLCCAGCGGEAPRGFREPTGSVVRVETNVQALQAWAGAKARADVLVHIDAVDDLAVFPPALAPSMKNAGDHLSRGTVSVLDPLAPMLENGGTVNLGHAAGLYGRVIWVVPAAGSVADAPVENLREVLAARRGYDPEDLADLRIAGTGAEGTIGGVPLTITTLDDLEAAPGRAILDIDLGWFDARRGQDPSYRPGTASLLNVLRVLGRKEIPVAYATITLNSPRQSIPLDIRYYGDIIEEILASPERITGPLPPLYADMIQAEEALTAGRYGEARTLYAELAARRPDMAGLFFSLGLVEGFLGHPEPSRAALLEAYRLDQAYLPGFFQLARVLAGMDRVETGEHLLATPDLIHLVPDVEMNNQRGFFYLAAGRPYDAITWLERVAAARDDDFAVRTVLRQAYEQTGDRAKEMRVLGELVSIDAGRVDRDMPWVRRRLGDLSLAAGDTATAAREYRRYLELIPEDEDAPRLRAIAGQPGP